MGPNLVVVGWDSATYEVIDPLMRAGRLPVLASLIEKGFSAGLRSTWPPMTDCAWTSAFTGRNPGAHGIFGSWYRAPGNYECRYFSARDRRVPAMWEVTEGARWLVWGVPMTFPPADIDGAMVSSYGAPPGSRFCTPDELQDEIAERWPLEDLLDRAPHGSLEAFRADLLRGLTVQAEALPWAIRETGADCVVAVWPHIDRAQHFFWQLRATSHPLAGTVDDVYEAMDRATGTIVEAFADANVLIVSDHGAGTLNGDVNVGAWLASRGYAAYGDGGRSLTGIAWRLPPRLRRAGKRLAPALAARAMTAALVGQLGPFDWPATKAFLGVHGDLWVNLEGRERSGIVAEEDASGLLDEIVDGLLDLTDPRTGGAVFAAAHPRAEIYSGPALDLAPDMILDSWSCGYRVAPRRAASLDIVVPPSALTGVEEAWSADHRPVGIFAGSGGRIAAGRVAELSLYDVAPTALALLEQEVPAGLDGRVVEEAIEPGWLSRHPVSLGAEATARAGGGEYSRDEAEAVATHLRDLGYIE